MGKTNPSRLYLLCDYEKLELGDGTFSEQMFEAGFQFDAIFISASWEAEHDSLSDGSNDLSVANDNFFIVTPVIEDMSGVRVDRTSDAAVTALITRQAFKIDLTGQDGRSLPWCRSLEGDTELSDKDTVANLGHAGRDGYAFRAMCSTVSMGVHVISQRNGAEPAPVAGPGYVISTSNDDPSDPAVWFTDLC